MVQYDWQRSILADIGKGLRSGAINVQQAIQIAVGIWPRVLGQVGGWWPG